MISSSCDDDSRLVPVTVLPLVNVVETSYMTTFHRGNGGIFAFKDGMRFSVAVDVAADKATSFRCRSVPKTISLLVYIHYENVLTSIHLKLNINFNIEM